MGRKKNELDLLFALGKGVVKAAKAAEKEVRRRESERERQRKAHEREVEKQRRERQREKDRLQKLRTKKAECERKAAEKLDRDIARREALEAKQSAKEAERARIHRGKELASAQRAETDRQRDLADECFTSRRAHSDNHITQLIGEG